MRIELPGQLTGVQGATPHNGFGAASRRGPGQRPRSQLFDRSNGYLCARAVKRNIQYLCLQTKLLGKIFHHSSGELCARAIGLYILHPLYSHHSSDEVCTRAVFTIQFTIECTICYFQSLSRSKSQRERKDKVFSIRGFFI